MFEKLSEVIFAVDDVIWGWWLIILLFSTHIFMTFKTGFIQWKTITKGIRLSVTKDHKAEGEVSNFGTLTTALAATIGTGNIVGVGTAIALGGPGAVFWCWLSGVFGIATKYAESLIAVKYRVKKRDGRMQGGAMYALSRGLKWQPLGKILGMTFAVFAGFASFGIGCATQVNAIASVVEETAGVPGWLVGLAVAALTAVVIFGGIRSIARVCEKLVPFMALFYVLGCIIILGINYDYIIPAIRTILTLGIICFAYSTVLGWAYYGERAVEYFAGKKGLLPYRILYVAVAAIAPVAVLDVVWALADILNALMAIPNLLAVLLLSNVIAKETKKYINDLEAWEEEEVPVVDD